MRLLWYSNAPWAPSGYGQQTALWVPKLQSIGHDVAVAAFHGLQGSPLNWGGMTVYPGSGEDQWAQDVMMGHYQHHKADMLITLMDAWVLDSQLLATRMDQGMRTVHWLPVDCEPLGVLDYRLLSTAGTRPIAMSRHGFKQLAEFGPLYVPHGIDTSLFAPVPEEQVAAARERGGFTDMFVIGMNAANQDPVRKGFGEQLCAFRLLADRHPDVRMLIHTRKVARTGSNLERLVNILHLEPYVQFGDQYLTVSGLTSATELARWYSIMDLFTNCAYGEGFGLPILEAQAAGTPVVVTDGSAMTELCGSGWLADGEWYWNAGHGSWWVRPSVQNIFAAYEQAYQEWKTPEAAKRRQAAREFALQYDADTVLSQYWEPVLDELEGVAGTEKDAGLRWLPKTLPATRDETAREAILDLIPEGGVYADSCAGSGYFVLPAARKASRVVAAGNDRLAENAALNRITNVEVQDDLDVSAEPFVDVIRLAAAEVRMIRDMINLHQPALAICDGKGKGDMFREWLKGHGYSMRNVPDSRCVIAVRS